MVPLDLTDITFDRDDFGRITAVAGTGSDGKRLEFAVETSVEESKVETRGVLSVDGSSVLELTANVDHRDEAPWMVLRATSGDETHYQAAAMVDETDGSISVEGSANGESFAVKVARGEDLPDSLPDLDAALPRHLQTSLAPLAPLVAIVAASASQPARPRKSWWRRVVRYGCLGAGTVLGIVICGATSGIGCAAGATVATIAGAACADAAHDA